MCCWKLEVDAIGSNFRDIQILFFREEHRLMVFENRVVNSVWREEGRSNRRMGEAAK
jgi:hypothetical protein